MRTVLLLLLLTSTLGCWSADERSVVVYCALDREFSEPLLQDFEQSTDVRVLAKYDVESTKTVGLVNAILQEQNQPRCDLFWNNEILHTLRLQKLGVLEAYFSPQAARFPAGYRSAEGMWTGFAARGRVLIVNRRVPAAERPRSVRDLVDPRWQGKCGLAKPLFGTTATHAAVLFSRWGDERAREFFRGVKQNAQVLSGNKQVALSVARGQLDWGLTDTDDALIERDQAEPVDIVFPDQGDGEEGALFIPNSLCLIRGAPHSAEAKRLIDHLLAPAIEERLAAGASGQIPVHPDAKQTSRVLPVEQTVRGMDADFPAAAEAWEQAAKFLAAEFGAK